MANTFIVLFGLSAVISTAFSAPTPQPNECVCQTNLTSEEVQELFKFLETEPSTDTFPDVAPGEISPLVCGNCIEHTRRKRKISPDEAVDMPEDIPEDVSENVTEDPSEYEVNEVTSNEVNDVVKTEEDNVDPPESFGLKCPTGEKRLSNWCIPIDDY